MKVVTAFALLLMVGLVVGTALADPNAPAEPKPWHPDLSNQRAVYPETGTNDVCPGPQLLAVGDVIDPADFSVTTDDDWYQLQITAADLNTPITIGSDVSTGCSTGIDTYLYLFSDCATQLAYDDDSGPGLYSQLTYTFTTPGIYNIKMQSYAHSYTGCYKLFVSGPVPPPPPPVNDQCSGALLLGDCDHPTGDVTGDLTAANNDYDPGSGGCATGYNEAGKDVAYVLNLNAGDHINLLYTGNNFDAAIYIITDCSNPAGTCVAGADASYNVETVSYTAANSGTYYVIADAYGTGAGGTFTLHYELTCAGPSGACCNPTTGACTETQQSGCSGNWMGEGTNCNPNLCPQPPEGACCLPNGTCVTAHAFDCTGAYQGDGTSCDTVQCPVVPTQPATWGQIKNIYH